MEYLVLLLAVLSVFAVTNSVYLSENEIPNVSSLEDAKMHVFVVLVPESSVKALKKKARQEEEATETVTETGVYVGQIISGVLGGDVRPIFAGSASFIGEPDVQQGVSTILANVAPSLNNILKQWVGRVQTALGLATTPRPGSATLSNQTRPSNGVIVGRPITVAEASRLTPQQILAQQQLQQQQIEQRITQDISSLPQAVSNGASGNGQYEFSTVEPLPLINPLKPDKDEDENEENRLKAV